jgi:Putative small multi-drug export protein
MATLAKLLSAAALGAIDLWLGIPVGLASGLPPVASGTAATTGGLVGAALVTLAGERLQRWAYGRGWLAKRRERVERMWNRYGILGVALQAPILTGAPLGTLVALGLGAPTGKLLFWMGVSLTFWGAILTGAAVMGFEIFGG